MWRKTHTRPTHGNSDDSSCAAHSSSDSEFSDSNEPIAEKAKFTNSRIRHQVHICLAAIFQVVTLCLVMCVHPFISPFSFLTSLTPHLPHSSPPSLLTSLTLHLPHSSPPSLFTSLTLPLPHSLPPHSSPSSLFTSLTLHLPHSSPPSLFPSFTLISLTPHLPHSSPPSLFPSLPSPPLPHSSPFSLLTIRQLFLIANPFCLIHCNRSHCFSAF